MNPLNLLLRFSLELIALFAIGFFFWTHFHGFAKIILSFSLPIVVMVTWGTFAVPNDPSRNGKAPVAVNGISRLIIECVIFFAGFLALFFSCSKMYSYIFLFFIIIHYTASIQRIRWLVEQSFK
ncbi:MULTISPECIES: YrdB family protein [Bacillus]|nr:MULTISPECIES: YrdB family protein [Bacillus]